MKIPELPIGSVLVQIDVAHPQLPDVTLHTQCNATFTPRHDLVSVVLVEAWTDDSGSYPLTNKERDTIQTRLEALFLSYLVGDIQI